MRGLVSLTRSTAPSNGMNAKGSAAVPLSSPAAAQRCAKGTGLDSGAAAAHNPPSIASCSVIHRRSLLTHAAPAGAPQLQSGVHHLDGRDRGLIVGEINTAHRFTATSASTRRYWCATPAPSCLWDNSCRRVGGAHAESIGGEEAAAFQLHLISADLSQRCPPTRRPSCLRAARQAGSCARSCDCYSRTTASRTLRWRASVCLNLARSEGFPIRARTYSPVPSGEAARVTVCRW